MHSSISRENIDIQILPLELVLKSDIQQQQRLTVKELPVMRVFWAFAKKPDTDCWACSLLVTAKNIFVSVTHREILFRICISQVGPHHGIRRGEWIFLRIGYSSNRQSGDRSRNLAFMGILINDDLAHYRLMTGTLTGVRSSLAKAETEVETRRSSCAV